MDVFVYLDQDEKLDRAEMCSFVVSGCLQLVILIRFGICSLTARLNSETKEERNKRGEKKAGGGTGAHLLMKVKHHSAPA